VTDVARWNVPSMSTDGICGSLAAKRNVSRGAGCRAMITITTVAQKDGDLRNESVAVRYRASGARVFV